MVRAMGALPYRRNKDVGDPLGVTISAWAAPLNHPNVTTIAAPAGVSLLGPPMVGGDLYLDAPRDAIRLENCFLVRYFTNEGARRALVQATAVEAQPGMRDLVRGRLLAEP